MKPWPLFLLGLGAWAGDFSLETTTDLLYRHDPMAIGAGQYQGSLSLVASQGPWTFGLTGRDVNFYQYAQQNPDLTLSRPTAYLYKRYGRYEHGPWILQAGDFNTMFGRGLVLSVIQNPAILQEETVDGGDVRWRGGRLELHALSGSVASEKRDQSRQVEGLEAVVEWSAGQRLGLRACTIQDGQLAPFTPRVGLRQGSSFSVSGTDPGGSVSYYGELGRVEFRDQALPPYPTPVDPRQGRGAYGNLSFHHRAWFLMAEYKDYRNFDTGLNNPPLADRDTEKNDLYDGSGRRLYAQVSLPSPDLTLFLSAGAYRNETWEGHGLYGGFKLQDGFDRLDLACTYGLKTVQFPEKKTDATLTWRFTPLWSLGLTLRDKRNRPAWSAPYEETDLTLQVARSPRFAVYVLQQRSTVAVFGATRMYNAGIRVNLPKGAYVDLSGGRLRGGEVCAGGQCLTLPPFKGWKLAAHVRW